MTQKATATVHLLLRELGLIFYYEEEKDSGIDLRMDWINCNLCCCQPCDERERTFTLSSCGHIFCDFCLARVESRDKCAVCSSMCQLMQLSSKMKPDAEVFFQEPATLIKKHFTLVTRLLDFQRDHRIRLVSFHRKIVQKYREMEKQMAMNKSQEVEKYNAAKVRIQELERELQRLRSVVASMDHSEGGASSSGNSGKRVSPKVSPGGTIISPGRITMVKRNHGQAGGSRGMPNISPTAPYAPHQSTATTRAKAFSPVSCQYYSPQIQQPRHPEGLQHSVPGINYIRGFSPAMPRKSSPARIMPGTSSHVPMSGTLGHSGTPGFQPFMRPPQPQLQSRPLTPVNFTSVDPYGRQPHELSAYKKFTM